MARILIFLAVLALPSQSFARHHRKEHYSANSKKELERSSRKSSAGHSSRESKTRHFRSTSRHGSKHAAPSHARNKHAAPSRPSFRSGQQTPSPERYQEIQQALADRGYYHGELNGVWSSESVTALKNFQLDQNLKPDGKLGSVSLIAMGLGPKRTLNAQSKTSQQDPEQPSTQP